MVLGLHLDTDLGADPDDACALAMLLGSPEVEVVGVTTCADPDGRRAGYVTHLLRMLGREDIPVAAGAGASTTTARPMGRLPDHAAYWGAAPVPARPGPVEVALDLLAASVGAGAAVAAIGPSSNLALLERRHSGSLTGARVVAMGGWVRPSAAGLPPWGPARDWNVQCDPDAATLLLERADLTLVALPATATATLRRRDLPALAGTGAVGALLAGQSERYGADRDYASLGPAYPALPDDLVNFHWDPVTCAVALGWPGATVERMRLRPAYDADGALRFEPDGEGRPAGVVTDVDGAAFTGYWLARVAAAQRPS